MLPGQTRYWRLDLNPDVVWKQKKRHDLHEWSPKKVFAQDDLYTTRWGNLINTDVEQFFFGRVDNNAPQTMDFISTFNYKTYKENYFQDFMTYMSLQKLRTPKGLAAFAALAKSYNRNATLILIQQLKNIYSAIWTEGVWQIAEATNSPTKFIISDHPVTVYNRACPPLSKYCRFGNDPDIRLHATHTYFPLSLEKVLILTNLSWVRNPYQSEVGVRPNPKLFRTTMFNMMGVQTGRMLSEDEVLQINSITKRRAYRYIAAAEKEWLYPEKYVSTDYWKKFGDGWLLMPEPRLVHMGGKIVIGYRGGGGASFGEYGHRPWQKGYEDKSREEKEWKTLERFKAEWAMKFGSKYVANNADLGRFSLREDSDKMTEERKKIVRSYRTKGRA
jgi:Protein of unknown function (DUF4238)